LKPGVMHRGVPGNHIETNTHASSFCFANKRAKIRERSVSRSNLVEIRNIVTGILERGFKYRPPPQRADAKIPEIIQF